MSEIENVVRMAAKEMKWSEGNLPLLFFHAKRLGLEAFINVWQLAAAECDNPRVISPGAIFNKMLRATPTPKQEGGAK